MSNKHCVVVLYAYCWPVNDFYGILCEFGFARLILLDGKE